MAATGRYINVVNKLYKGLNSLSPLRYATHSSTTNTLPQPKNEKQKNTQTKTGKDKNVLQTKTKIDRDKNVSQAESKTGEDNNVPQAETNMTTEKNVSEKDRTDENKQYKTVLEKTAQRHISNLFLDKETKLRNRKELEVEKIARLSSWINFSKSLNYVLKMTLKFIKEEESLANALLVIGLRRINELYMDAIIVPNQNKDLMAILVYVEENIKNLSHNELLCCIDSLMTITEANNCSRILQHHALSILNLLTISQVIDLYSMSVQNNRADLHPNVLDKCKNEIIKRCSEIEKVKDLLMVMQQPWAIDGKVFIDDLEGKFVTTVDKMSRNQLVGVLNSLSRNHFRHILVMQTTIDHLIKCPTSLTVSEIQQVLKSCKRLSIYNIQLFNKVSTDLLTGESSNMSTCLSLLSFFSRLKWCDENVITTLLGNLLNERVTSLTPMMLSQILLSASYLNFCPKDKIDMLQTFVMDTISNDQGSPEQMLTMVWSLVVLQGASNDMVAFILGEEFCQKIEQGLVTMSDHKSRNYSNCLWKLRNIECSTECDLHNYEGPHLLDGFKAKEELTNSKPNPLTVEVLDVLKSVVTEKYKAGVMSPCGYYIDAELLIDKNGEVVDYTDSDVIPENIHRLAIKVLDFHSLILPNYLPAGPQSMMIRHLIGQGYKVVVIPCNEWSDVKSQDKQKEYLKTLIKNSVL